MSYLSSTTSDHLHSLGGGSGMNFVPGGLGPEDMLEIQQTAATTEVSMFPNYLSTATNHELHNGLINMDITTMSHPLSTSSRSHLLHRNELPLMRHRSTQMLDRYHHQQYQEPLSSSLYYNNNEHHSFLTTNNSHNASPRQHHQQQHRLRAGRQYGLSTSSPLLNTAGDPWLDGQEEEYLRRDTDYLSLPRPLRGGGGQGDKFGLVNDFNSYSSTTAPPSPRKGSSLAAQQQIRQPTHRTTHHGYNVAAVPAKPTAASNYDSSLRYNTDHFSAAVNLNAHYPPGGGGGPPGLDTAGGQTSGGGFFGVGGTRPGGAVGGTMGMMGGGAGEDEMRQQSASSESQAYYGNETMVKELRPEFVRWFYRYEQDRKWRPFTGYDSIRIESKYRDVYRDQVGSYSHSAYYPVASSNDESTDFSKFVHQQQLNNNLGGGQQPGGRFSDMMSSQKWWPGKGPETTCDTEFNNGGPGFPNQVRNHSVGNSLFGRMGNNGGGPSGSIPGPGGIRPDRTLYKANSASALLGNGGNGMHSISPNHHPDINHIVVVREGLYEVDIGSWTCFSTYWPGDTCLITRGTWFYDGTWDPLPVEQAEKLEEAHMLKFCGSALINHQQNIPGQSHPDDPQKQASGNSANAPAIHRITFNEFHVDWKSPQDIFWYSQATSHKLMRSFGQKLGLSDWSHRICRGYYKPAVIHDRPSEISHIVFVIHGIGQKMDTGRIVRNCSAFRDCVQSMKDKYFPQLNNAKHRAEFFPVEWRSAAKLDNDVVEAITPQKLVSLRQLLNSTAMDIMYYTSPLYRAEIQNALIEELNRIYANFVKRNPSFVMNGGKVSVMAHSLGAVITYDILTGYLCGSVEDEIALMQQQQLHIPRRVIPHQQGLLFTLEHFFCLGSPLSVFLALRWREPHDAALRSQILPQHLCRRIYNVFYSSDPVAYRLEPLLNRHYVKIAPVTIHSYTAPNKPRYCDMPRERITIVSSKTGSDNTNTTNATSTLPVPFAEVTAPTQKTTPTSKPTLPSLPSVLPSVPSPNKETNNTIGGWLGKMWKGATNPGSLPNPVSGMSLPNPMGGMSLSNPMGGMSLSNPMGGMSLPNPMGGISLPNSVGGLSMPNPVGGLAGMAGALDPTGSSSNHPNPDLHNPGNLAHPTVDEATFLAQNSKDNYATVIDEELLNIPNDLTYRLDYVLRESQFSGSSYLAALTSHTSYWNSPDAAYFVMTHLYDELIEQTSYSGDR